MEKRMRKIGKQFLAMLMVGVMLLSSLTLVPTQEVEAASIPGMTFVTNKAKELLGRAVVYGLSEAADAAGGDSIVLNTALWIMQSPTSTAIAKTQELCRQTLAELESIDTQLASISAQNEKIIKMIQENTILSQSKEMDKFRSDYVEAVTAYEKMLTCLKTYADNATSDNYEKFQNAYGEVNAFYIKMKPTEDGKEPVFLDSEQIRDYLFNVTKYEPESEKIKEDSWVVRPTGSGITTKAYTELIIDYYESTTMTQAKMYEAISNSIAYSVEPLYYYLKAFQIYTIMRVNEINTDSSYTHQEKQDKINFVWSNFEKGKNYVGNAINQLIYDYYDILTTYMRDYDTEPTKVTMDFKESRTIYPDCQLVTQNHKYTTEKNVTKSEMGYTIIKLRDGTTYAVYSDSGNNTSVTLGDLIYRVKSKYHLIGENHVISCDYKNLLKGRDSWAGFQLISSAMELQEIINYESYALAENNLALYFSETEPYGVLGDYKNTGKKPYYGVTSTMEEADSYYTSDDKVVFYNLKDIKKSEIESADDKLDLEDNITDKGSSMTNLPCGIIMKQTAPIELNLNTSDVDDSVAIKIEKYSDNTEIERTTEDYKITAGERINIKVKVDDGKEIENAILYGETEIGEWKEIERFADADDLKDCLDYCDLDADGYYSLSVLPMPYRNVKLSITVKDKKAETSYSVELQQSDTAELQFAELPGMDYMTYQKGDTVNIRVWPYDNNIIEGITIVGESGETLTNIKVVEDESDDNNFPVTVKNYQFQMPAENVKIMAIAEKGYEVSLGEASNGKLVFTNATGTEVGNGESSGFFAPGERIYIKGIPKDEVSYYCREIIAKERASKKPIEVRAEQEGISFIMPETSVDVMGTFIKWTQNQYPVSVDIEKYNADGTVKINGIASTTAAVPPGKEVIIKVIPDEDSWFDGYTVTDYAGEKIECKEGVDVEDSKSTISFTMPEGNVNVKIIFKSAETLSYSGTLSVDSEIKASVIEVSNDDTETEILSDISQGSATFQIRPDYCYKLLVTDESLEENADIKVTQNYKNNETTLSYIENENRIYKYDITPSDPEGISGDLTVKVRNNNAKTVEYDFYINNYEDLVQFRRNINKDSDESEKYKNASYLITADIVVPENDIYGAVGTFYGVLDGGGHKIINLNQGAVNDSFWPQGFICRLGRGGVIQNLELENVSSNAGTGGTLVGKMMPGSKVINCKVSGNNNMSGSEIAGIAHTVSMGATIQNSRVTGVLNSTGNNMNALTIGGIACYNNGSIENSYFAGQIQMTGGGGTEENTIGGISAADSSGKIVNCYVKDGFVDNIDFKEGVSNRVYDIGHEKNTFEYVYVSQETNDLLKSKADSGVISYTTNSSCEYMLKNEMAAFAFAELLNENIEKLGKTETYLSWKQENDINDAYPYFYEEADIYTVKMISVVAGVNLAIQDQAGNSGNELKIHSGTTVYITGEENTKSVEIEAWNVTTNERIVKTEATPNSKGKIRVSFLMPVGDVEVTVSEKKVNSGKIPVSVQTYPSEKASAQLQDVNGNPISEAKLSDTVYVQLNKIDEAYEIDEFVFQSNMLNEAYKKITDFSGILQEDGRYAVTFDGGEKNSAIINGKATLCIVDGYKVSTEVLPENAGTITCSKDMAQVGEEVTYSVSTTQEDSMVYMTLCKEDGTIIEVLDLQDGKGSFTMPDSDVIVKGLFIGNSYIISKKNSDHLKLSTVNAEGENIYLAAAGEAVTVCYEKTLWSTAEIIEVYRLSEYGQENADAMMSWTVLDEKNSQENPLTFVMPNEGVVIASHPVKDPVYNLSTEIEGEGRVLLRDLFTFDKEQASFGEKIIVSAYADRGWTLDQENSHICDSEGITQVNSTKYDSFITFAMPAKDLTVKAVFVQKDYKVTLEPSEKGTITVTDENGEAIDLNRVHYEDNLKIKVSDCGATYIYCIDEKNSDNHAVNISLDENGETVITMPDSNITIGIGYRMNQDEENNYLLYTVDDLKQIAQIVAMNPNANFKLMNSINAEGITFTQTIGSEENPYGGTFDGQGYSIFKFNMNHEDGDAAFFGTISVTGIVKRLGVFYENATGSRAAGIAVVNNGLIDECISGSNLMGTFTDKETGERHNLSETNTFVTGEEMAGGIVVENYGLIQNTTNYAEVIVSASEGVAGGIAAVNGGRIVNSFNEGDLLAESKSRSNSEKTIGGIVGMNLESGSINIAYCIATTIEGDLTGAIFGQNDNGTVENTYYLNKLSGNAEQGTAKSSTEMNSDAFKDELNRLRGENTELREWYRDTNKNSGYPLLLSSMLVEKEIYNENSGITVKGLMHEHTMLQVTKLDGKSKEYEAFEAYAEKYDMQVRYAGKPELTLIEEDSIYIGNLNLKVDPTKYNGKEYKVLTYQDGKIEEVKMSKQKIASLSTEELPWIAILTDEASASGTTSKPAANDKNTKTGDNRNVLIWSVIFLSAALVIGGMVIYRRKKKNNR